MGGSGLGDNGRVRRLWATVWEWNTASRRVLAKVGFAETERQETPHGTNCVTTRQL